MKQSKITDGIFNGTISPQTSTDLRPIKKTRTARMVDEIDIAELKSSLVWDILADTARRNPMYPGLSGYIRSEVLPKNPNIKARELASQLSISLGEAIVLLEDAKEKK